MRICSRIVSLLLTLACHCRAAVFSVDDGVFKLDGKPFQIRSGEIHYPRVPRDEWENRIGMAKAMGLNTISTYLFWNYHELQSGDFDFGGEKDVAEFISLCGRMGMRVIVRPGPYVCAEWELGGIPARLLAIPGIRLRSPDPRFLQPAREWMRRVGALLHPLEVASGGPVLLVQLENEYGYYGADALYLAELEKSLRGGGYQGMVFTADGGSAASLRNGGREDLLKAVNFGDGAPKAMSMLAEVAPGQPQFCAEYWVGWFDIWGQRHKTVAPARKTGDLQWLMRQGASFNIYMFHGGTTRGLWSGANWSDGYQPTCDNYDYDAPLDESGRPTPKFGEFRAIIARWNGGLPLPPVPEREPAASFGNLELTEHAAFVSSVGEGTAAQKPVSMEDLGQSTGSILYRFRVDGPAKGILELGIVKDRAYIVCDGRLVGIGGRSVENKPTEIGIDLGVGGHQLDIIVENMGRINFGYAMAEERKGLMAPPRLNGKELAAHRHVALPMQEPPAGRYSAITGGPGSPVPALLRGKFAVPEKHDTWLNMGDFGRGIVWLNGRNIGRYWSIGPSHTLFVPGCWLRTDKPNDLVILELEKTDCPRSVPTMAQPVWRTPGRK